MAFSSHENHASLFSECYQLNFVPILSVVLSSRVPMSGFVTDFRTVDPVWGPNLLLIHYFASVKIRRLHLKCSNFA